jgi:hypothetical protein
LWLAKQLELYKREKSKPEDKADSFLDNTMAPRSQLEITTSSVIRLVKEEASYHQELQQQTERVKRLEAETAGDDENREYMLKQEVCS